VDVVGADVTADDLPVGPDSLESYRVFVAAPPAALEGDSTDVRFQVVDKASGAAVSYDSVFRGPDR